MVYTHLMTYKKYREQECSLRTRGSANSYAVFDFDGEVQQDVEKSGGS